MKFIDCGTKIKVYDDGVNDFGCYRNGRIGTIRYSHSLRRHLYHQSWYAYNSVLRLKPLLDKLKELDKIKREN